MAVLDRSAFGWARSSPECCQHHSFERMLFARNWIGQTAWMERKMPMRNMSGVLAGLVLAILSGVGARDRSAQTKDVGWPSYGNDAGGGRYSEARQIDPSNVGQLKVAWTFRTGAL